MSYQRDAHLHDPAYIDKYARRHWKRLVAEASRIQATDDSFMLGELVDYLQASRADTWPALLEHARFEARALAKAQQLAVDLPADEPQAPSVTEEKPDDRPTGFRIV